MKLSILDQAPISEGQSARDALQVATKLAQLGDRLGYERYWIAEHHDLFGLACPNPDVMLGILGTQTKSIRLGAGAVLLPYYKPFRVAETYNLLATMFPNRIDLGLGRAPGGSAEVSLALADNYLKQVGEFPQQVTELQQFLTGTFSEGEMFAKISPTPIPPVSPEIWMLGTSEKSANLAAEQSLSYAFGHFMTSEDGPEMVQQYRDNFYADKQEAGPYVTVAIEVVCAATTARAEKIASSSILWKVRQDQQASTHFIPSIEEAWSYPYSDEEQIMVDKIKQRMIIGNPSEVEAKLQALQNEYQADEWMIITITHDPHDKYQSYELIKEMCLK